MSTFPGPLSDVPGVWIDKFVSKNTNWRKCKAFFLSHAHSDHMGGLDAPEFANHMCRTRGAKIFMSEVTKTLLVNWPNQKYRDILDFIQVLSFDRPLELENCDGKYVLFIKAFCKKGTVRLKKINKKIRVYKKKKNVMGNKFSSENAQLQSAFPNNFGVYTLELQL